jgi:hypothetical protein
MSPAPALEQASLLVRDRRGGPDIKLSGAVDSSDASVLRTANGKYQYSYDSRSQSIHVDQGGKSVGDIPLRADINDFKPEVVIRTVAATIREVEQKQVLDATGAPIKLGRYVEVFPSDGKLYQQLRIAQEQGFRFLPAEGGVGEETVQARSKDGALQATAPFSVTFTDRFKDLFSQRLGNALARLGKPIALESSDELAGYVVDATIAPDGYRRVVEEMAYGRRITVKQSSDQSLQVFLTEDTGRFLRDGLLTAETQDQLRGKGMPYKGWEKDLAEFLKAP